MEVLIGAGDGWTPSCVRLRDRLSAAWHADALDRRLAEGASPEESVATALRARRLTSRRTRRSLARALDAALRNATTPAVAGVRHARLAAEGVAAAAPELAALRTRLLTQDITSVRGVAATRLLLVDGGGPVHDVRRVADLRGSVRRALAAFDTPVRVS